MKWSWALWLVWIVGLPCYGQLYEHRTTQLAHWTTPVAGNYSDIWGYAANGREYAILGSNRHILFLDVTNPASPNLIRQFGPFTSTSWREFKTYGHYAYAVSDGADNTGLRIFDLRYLPDSVVQVRQTTAFFNTCHMPFIDEANGRLYCAGTNTQNGGIIVLDLTSRPDSPSIVINQGLPGGYVHDLYVKNNIIYASHIYGGTIAIYNCTGSSCSGQLSSYTTGGLNHSSWMHPSGTWMVNAIESAGHPMYSIPLSNPTSFNSGGVRRFKSVTLREQYPGGNASDTGSIAHNPYFVGNLIFASYYTDGVQVFNAADPANIRRIAYFDTDRGHTSYSPGFRGCWGVYPFLPSQNILASDIQSGLWIFKLNPSALALQSVRLAGKLIGDLIELSASGMLAKEIRKMEIEKSFDGHTFRNWKHINLSAFDETFDKKYFDEDTRIENYYRIKITGEDGTIEYSSLVKISARVSRFLLFPNPVSDRFSYIAPDPLIRLALLDLQGKIVFVRQDISAQDEVMVPTSIPNGIYAIKAQGPFREWTEKIVIHR
jgi:hypothetical protein